MPARDLFRQIAKAAWECADPGMQFDTTINRWHTAPNTGRINASNPCSEYMHIDNSACNLASLNLLTFLDDDGTFDVDGFKAATEVVFTAQEILVGNADYPTEKIAENSRRFRQLGIGYANLGALLMAQGLPYDSDGGRAWAGGHHRAADRARLRHLGPDGGPDGPLRRLPGEPRAHARGAAHAPRRRGRASTRSWCRPSCCPPPRRPGTRAVELGRAVRRAQLPGQRAGPDRHHRPADGLRHDRRRARSRPGQDEEAGRRRHHVHRQPDGAPRPAPGSATDAEQIDEIVAYIDEHKSILGAPAPGRRAPAGLRLLDGRQPDPLPGPRPDDGRGPAVHLAVPSPRRSTCPRT